MKKKILKRVLIGFAVVLLVLLVALAAHPLWLGPLVKTLSMRVGPNYTGTPIMLTDCNINLYSGHIEMAGFELSNPAGCSERVAASVGSLKVDLDTLSMLSDIIVVRSVEVSGIFVSYVKGASGKYNFTEIADTAKGGSKKEGSAPQKAEPPPSDKPQVAKKGDAPKSEEKAGKKVVIERLSVGDVKVAAYGVNITLLPGTIVLTDIGKKSKGATIKEIWDVTYDRIVAASGDAGKQLIDLGVKFGKEGLEYGKKGIELGKQGIDAGTEGVKKAVDSVKSLDASAAKDALKSTGDGLKSAGDGLLDLGKGAGKGVKSVGNSLKSLF